MLRLPSTVIHQPSTFQCMPRLCLASPRLCLVSPRLCLASSEAASLVSRLFIRVITAMFTKSYTENTMKIPVLPRFKSKRTCARLLGSHWDRFLNSARRVSSFSVVELRAEYCRKVAEGNGITELFEGFSAKPDIVIDDMGDVCGAVCF